jgi:hypothetical protein
MRILTAVPGLMLTRRDEKSHPESCFYQPMIAFIAQGWKRAMIGNKEYSYGEGSCMVVGVDMPGVSYYEGFGGTPFFVYFNKVRQIHHYPAFGGDVY